MKNIIKYIVTITLLFVLIGCSSKKDNKITYFIDNEEISFKLDTFSFEVDMKLPEPTKDGFLFDGWYLDNNIKVNNTNQLANQNVVLKGYFYKTFIFTLDYNGIQENEFLTFTEKDNLIVDLPDLDIEGYLFDGWYLESGYSGSKVTKLDNLPNSDVTVFAKLLKINTIIFNYGNIIPDESLTYTTEDEIMLPEVNIDGYTFEGWYDNKAFNGVPLESFDPSINSDITLYAKFDLPEEYALLYMIDGILHRLEPNKFNKYDNFDLPIYEKEGVIFLGWYDNPNFEGNELKTTKDLNLEHTYLYAKIYKPTTLTLNYNTDYIEVVEQTFYNGDVYSLPTEMIRKYYVFEGWYESPDFSGDAYEFYTFYLNKNITLYAKWKIDITIFDDLLLSYNDNELTHSLVLPNALNEIEVTYISTNENILSNEGILQREYEPTTLYLEVNLDDDIEAINKSYLIKIAGYKSLDIPIAAGYIYRNYHLVTNELYETLDIINTSFADVTLDGEVINSGNYFYNATSLMPKAKEYGVRVIMSISPHAPWSYISADANVRLTFANSIVETINAYGFDGVDIDWETPKATEESNYTEMIKVIYEKVKQNNPNHIVSTAIIGGSSQPPRYNFGVTDKYVDYVNLMSYGLANHTGLYHNNLYSSRVKDNPANNAGWSLTNISIHNAVALLNTLGVDNSKIIVGVAFYGIQQGLNESSQWINFGSIHYQTILDYIASDYVTEYYDLNAQVPYAISSDGKLFISYDNRTSILVKSQYIIDNNLGGMMYWENGTDTTGILLQAIKDGLKS